MKGKLKKSGASLALEHSSDKREFGTAINALHCKLHLNNRCGAELNNLFLVRERKRIFGKGSKLPRLNETHNAKTTLCGSVH